MNRFGFNGLFRVNSMGEFNVPYGRPQRLPEFPLERMKAAANKLRRCTVRTGDFAGAMAMAGDGDVVYCDPPYSASSTGESFTSYTKSRFAAAEHEALVRECLLAFDRGATVLVSNHDTPYTRELYRDWRIEGFSVPRTVSASARARVPAAELIAVLTR